MTRHQSSSLATLVAGAASIAFAPAAMAEGVMEGAMNGAIKGAIIGAVAGGLIGLFQYFRKKNKDQGPKDPPQV
ncbi:MAG TPA: hypothetical protein VEA69_25945 [Tepidisphaeraceae bacterium]|nr:hypothetical protein [Tepidisphaeraceae bacterium]